MDGITNSMDVSLSDLWVSNVKFDDSIKTTGQVQKSKKNVKLS